MIACARLILAARSRLTVSRPGAAALVATGRGTAAGEDDPPEPEARTTTKAATTIAITAAAMAAGFTSALIRDGRSTGGAGSDMSDHDRRIVSEDMIAAAATRPCLSAMNDPHRLQRFVIAQDRGETYAAAVGELRAGRKTSHWMWFVFPQVAGLGQSSMSRTYAISSLAEAQAYLSDPVLGVRLTECCRILTQLTGRSADDIFGAIDAVKLRSSMTLFARAAPDNPLFAQVLDQYFGGVADEATESRLDC
jgi:uncharacterized protein (DUF1810 family)